MLFFFGPREINTISFYDFPDKNMYSVFSGDDYKLKMLNILDMRFSTRGSRVVVVNIVINLIEEI